MQTWGQFCTDMFPWCKSVTWIIKCIWVMRKHTFYTEEIVWIWLYKVQMTFPSSPITFSWHFINKTSLKFCFPSISVYGPEWKFTSFEIHKTWFINKKNYLHAIPVRGFAVDKWASSCDYGHIGDQQRLRRAWVSGQSCQSLCCSHTWSMEVDEGSDQKSDI